MAKADDKVMRLVEQELQKSPDIEVKDLFEKVKGREPAVGKLSLRQFNARYPLQIKRRKSLEAGGGRRRATRPSRRRRQRQSDSQAAVREAFLRFASELTAAEERKDLVRVLAKVDGYVEEVLKAAGR